jgi:hypothetical protein
MSQLFLLDLFVMDYEFGISPHEVLASIKELERGETPTGVKAATQFRRPPLKGLWHKHFFAARFLVHNLLNALGNNGLHDIVEKAMDPAKSPIVTREMIEEVAHRVTHEPLEARDAAGKLTGEWIVYVKHGGKNYYLCINGHETADQVIYDRIAQHVVKDFPDIAKWIDDAAKTM